MRYWKQILKGLFLALLIWAVYSVLPANISALSVLHAAFDRTLPVPPAGSCSLNWLRAGLLSPSEAAEAYRAALDCGPVYLNMASYARPLDADLAAYAVQCYPASTAAWFWLGNTLKMTDQPTALNAFLTSTSLDPSNDQAWCEAGYLYEKQDQIELARTALYRCCATGDPGNKGCYGAGRMEEKLGNPQAAIAAYRLSIDPRGLKRAEELEKESGLP